MRSDRKIPRKRDETDSLTRPAGTTDAATSGLVVDALRSETASLPSDVQRTMESRLRHDFSRVRIHDRLSGHLASGSAGADHAIGTGSVLARKLSGHQSQY